MATWYVLFLFCLSPDASWHIKPHMTSWAIFRSPFSWPKRLENAGVPLEDEDLKSHGSSWRYYYRLDLGIPDHD